MDAIFQSFVSLGWWEILVTICNTLITFLIVKMFLFKPVRKMIAAREDEVNALFAQAEADRKIAEEMKKEYTDSLAGARKEAADIVSTAVKRATQRSEEIERAANREIAEMKQRAEASIEQERKKTINEVKDEIADLSIMIASKVVEREVKAEDHERMIADFISKVG